MALNPKFIVTSDLEELFRDKDSGVPLAGGIVTFYSDINRSSKKPVYQLTGSPPNYTYAALNNPCTLSDVGTFQDELGNNIVPYYYPYEGTPDENSSTIELYYITVESSGGVQQFTREGWPNFTADNVDTTADATNFIPNGQFLAHNDIVSASQPPVTTYAFGSQTLASQAIAQGGWNFIRTSGGASTFDNSFERIATGVAGLNDFPRYAFNFSCTSFSGTDLTRDLRIQWPDVNKFSSGNTPGSQDYTFYFSAMSNDSNSYVFSIRVIYYFGTGGSPSNPIDTFIQNVTISPGYSSFTVTIPGFPANAGTIGDNNDDYVSISIRGPSTTWDVQLTDFALLLGSVVLTEFPVETNAEMLSGGVAGWMNTPNPDGTDLYLPLVLTPTGMKFDDSGIGKIYASTSTTLDDGELSCDGSQYLTGGYSSIGIPYSRLQAKIPKIGNIPVYGTGINFITSYIGSAGLYIYQNLYGTGGSYAVPAAATSGFTMTLISAASNTGYGIMSMRNGSTAFVIRNLVAGVSTASSAGSSGFTVTTDTNLATQHTTTYISNVAAAAGLAGLYFTFYLAAGTQYYVWYRYNGAGADPAPGGTGIRIDLFTGDAASDVTNKTVSALRGGYGYDINTIAASAMTAGNYWTFGVPNVLYYVWYTIDGAGTDPAPGGTGIKVAILSTDNAATVSTKTDETLNGYSFNVPNFQGLFLRGYDPNSIWDYDSSTRIGYQANNTTGDVIGTLELDTFATHTHDYGLWTNGAGNTFAGGVPYVFSTPATATSASGGKETRPVNAYVNWVIKY